MNSEQESVLVLMRLTPDAEEVTRILAQGEVKVLVCTNLTECRHRMEQASALLIAEEVLVPEQVAQLLRLLKSQPPWSDLPLIILTGSGEEKRRAMGTVEPMGDVISLIEWPSNGEKLLAAVRAASITRKNQFRARDTLEEIKREPERAREFLEQKLEELRTTKEYLAQQNQELKDSRVQLEREQLRYRELFDFAPDAYVVTNLNGRIDEVNLVGFRLFGQNGKELIGTNLVPFISLNGRKTVVDLVARFQKKKARESESLQVSICPRGQMIHCAITVNTVKDRHGRVVGLRWLVRDITAQRELEERLLQSQKMEAVGHLAGGMAHEFNNILAGIMINVDLVDLCGDAAERHELLRAMRTNCQRAAGLIKQLMAFSRRSVMEAKPVDIARVIFNQLTLLRRFLGERIRLETDIPDSCPWVKGDKALLEQVLLNLCLNARDAMLDGGTVRITLAQSKFKKDNAKKHPDMVPGRYVTLTVADTGRGMDEHTLTRLFEPFFTTKEVGRGTGLGLATVRGIVQQHQGGVEVESQVGKGSAFRIFLPAIAPMPSGNGSSEDAEMVPGSGTILLVEDELPLRNLTSALLTKSGYRVLESSNAEDALVLWAASRKDIDLVFTDMIMPGQMSGLELSRICLSEKPALKVVITSGYTANQVLLSKSEKTSIVYVPKPCPAATLTRVIRECLAPNGKAAVKMRARRRIERMSGKLSGAPSGSGK